MQSSLFAVFSALLLLSAQATATEKHVYGLHEKAMLVDLGMELPAKLDTGAVTASLSAKNIEIFKRDGNPFVRFELALEGDSEPQTLVRPLVRVSQIKRRAGDLAPGETEGFTPRPVIDMAVCMGHRQHTIEVNLTDRSAFEYPLLIGSEALKEFDALIDPELKYSAGVPGCA
jgi:hypothetical protein